MQLSAGLVIRIPDPRVRPKNKPKWHICVCPQRRLFLRINSSPLWQPYHAISAAKNAFLDHDSHVELTALHFFTESELRQATAIGRMSKDEAQALAQAAQGAITLNGEHKRVIEENLGQVV
jgi:hypothetical protein